MKYIALLITTVALLLGACNLRENILLPPNLDPAEYQTGNQIKVYSDYLIKSANDDSYFLLKKEAISDSMIFYGDVVTFEKVQSLTERDSLYFQTGTIPVSNTYKLAIKRDSVFVDLVSTIPLGYLYTNQLYDFTASTTKLIYDSFYLAANSVPIDLYTKDRCSFPIDKCGDFSLLQINSSQPVVINSNVETKALLLTPEEQFSFRLPEVYTRSAGSTNISILPSLSAGDVTTIQTVFPGFSLNSQVINVNTANSTDEIGIVLIKRDSKTLFGKQWIKLGTSQVSTWSEFDESNDQPEANWSTDTYGTYSFIKSSGKYFFATPIPTQNSLSIPFDGRFDRCFIQNLWLNLNDIISPSLSVKINLEPNTKSLLNSYFNASPYTLSGDSNQWEFSFWENGVQIEALPDQQWIEFGYRTAYTDHSNNRLLRYYSTSTLDQISYKTYATEYSADHFTAAGKYVYCSVANSGIYIYGNISESTTNLTIPYLKNSTYFQTNALNTGWNSSKKRGFSALNITLNPVNADTHPWTSGQPFSVSNKVTLAQARFSIGTSTVDDIPNEFFLSLPLAMAPSKLYLLSANADYPKFKEYVSGSSYLENTFVYNSGTLNIYPAYGGTIFLGLLTTSMANSYSILLNPRMKFELDALRVLMDVSTPIVGSAVINITRKAYMTDPYAILGSQYDLTATSDVYAISALNPILYDTHQPLILLKKNTRRAEILFSVINGGAYRIYPYPLGNTADGWHFYNTGNYNAFYVSSDGEYRTYSDNNPHTSTSVYIKNTQQDHIASLYQAQVTVPLFYMGSILPVNSRFELAQTTALPGVSNLLGAYRVSFISANNTQLSTNFFSVIGATVSPYVYVPVTDLDALPTMRMFYRNLAGTVTPLTRVTQFSDNFANEFLVIGNCGVALIDNSGWFYITY